MWRLAGEARAGRACSAGLLADVHIAYGDSFNSEGAVTRAKAGATLLYTMDSGFTRATRSPFRPPSAFGRYAPRRWDEENRLGQSIPRH